MFNKWLLWIAVAGVVGIISASANADGPRMGIVLMHGKGSSPSRHVDNLARKLEKKGYEVANIEMPWSGRREYDVDTDAADTEIDRAVALLREKGAQKIFVSGHSQGGAFATHYGVNHQVDGIIAIAPGGDVTAGAFQDKLGASVGKARILLAEGKGDKKANFLDYEGSRGTFSVRTTPRIYLTWFRWDSVMVYRNAVQNMNPKMPVLWIVAQDDYGSLRARNIPIFKNFPDNPYNQLYEPDSDHLGAPSASLEKIVEWTTEVANAK